MTTAFQRYNHRTGLSIAKGLNQLREYVKGDEELLTDIAGAWETYEAMFPAAED